MHTGYNRDLYFAIYDRWGELMFGNNRYNQRWGRNIQRQKIRSSAVFVYYIKAICRDKETFIKKGNVTLIR